MRFMIQDHIDAPKLMKTSGLLSSIHREDRFDERWGGSEQDSRGTPEMMRGGMETRLENTGENTPEITYVWMNHSLAKPTKQEVSSWGCSLTFGVRFYKNKHQKEVLSVDKFKCQQRSKC